MAVAFCLSFDALCFIFHPLPDVSHFPLKNFGRMKLPENI